MSPDVRWSRVSGWAAASPYFRGRWGRVVLGLFAGAAVGAVVFWASRLHGAGLFTLTGAAAGSVASLLIYTYTGSVGLEDVTITIPQLSELHFKVASDNRLVAWHLFVETTTRVSTQPLAPGSGNLREALSSLYSLFQAIRESLKGARPSRPVIGPTVEELGIAMLNQELRPFLSRWHPLLREWEQGHDDEPERSWEHNAECRAELAELQERLGSYVDGFAKLAGLRATEEWLRLSRPTSGDGILPRAGALLVAWFSYAPASELPTDVRELQGEPSARQPGLCRIGRWPRAAGLPRRPDPRTVARTSSPPHREELAAEIGALHAR
jgi:hypothetical protein